MTIEPALMMAGFVLLSTVAALVFAAYLRGRRRLQRSEDHFRTLFDGAPYGVVAMHVGTILSANAKARDILGVLSQEDLVDQPFLNFIDDGFRDPVARWLEAVMEDGLNNAGSRMDLKLLTDGKDHKYIEAHASVLDDGKAQMLVLSIQDVTDRIEAEDELRKLSRALEQSASAVVITGKDGTIEYVNSAFCRMTGYSVLEVLGQTPSLIRSPHRADEDYSELWHTIQEGGQWQGEFLNRAKDGSTFWVSANISPIRRPDGTITHYVGVEEDITRLKSVEGELREAIHQAEAANRTKSEFLANMSHELRTPLNAVIGFADILAEERFGGLGNEKYKEYAGDIRQSGHHLLQLINDILDVSRVEAGKLQLHEDLIDVPYLVQSAKSIISERVRAAELTMEIDMESPLPKLLADELRLKQVLLNLLGNAIKFTPPGGDITLSVGLDETKAFVFRVKDSGIGISPEDRDKIFTPFGQADSSLSRNHDGAGLGLPLSQSLVALHGGTISLDSKPGLGATFSVRLPRNRTRLEAS